MRPQKASQAAQVCLQQQPKQEPVHIKYIPTPPFGHCSKTIKGKSEAKLPMRRLVFEETLKKNSPI